MPRINDYQLLKDIYNTVDRLETKLDNRMLAVEARVDTAESRIDQITGKIGVFVAIITLTVSTIASIAVDFVKKNLNYK